MWKDEKQCTCMLGLREYLVTVSLFAQFFTVIV